MASAMGHRLRRASTMPSSSTSVSPSVQSRHKRLDRRLSSTSCESGSPGGCSSRGGSSVVVVARVRPRLKHESKQPECIEALPDRQTVLLANGREDKQFVLDQVFDSRQRNQEASETDRSAADDQSAFFNSFGSTLVDQSLRGYNVCLFAYGHTGSGKTYTMLGDAGGSSRGTAPGLLPRFLHQLFEEQARVPGLENWRCSCEFFEVYNEQIRDLLQPAQTQRARKVHCHPKHGARIEGLTMSVVNSVEDVLDLLNFGNQMRTVATTTMNARSSRSHAFFTFKYEAKGEAALPDRGQGNVRRMPFVQDQPCASTVTFVDLAGREERERLANQPGGVQYREMCSINTSLFHLAHLISKISSGQIERGSLSEFRNSKVTMLLSQALSGNSCTAVVATLSPLKSAFEDSLSTLNFATSAKKIKTKPVVNARAPSADIAELENEVVQLKRELAETKTRNIEKEQELQSATSWISYYKRSWEDAKARTEQQKLARTRSAARLGLASSNRGWASRASLSGTLSQDSADVQLDIGLPFLTKLSDDPALQGCCNFPLDRPYLRIGSKEGSCDIVLQGIGITQQVCTVRYSDDGTVMVEPLHGAPEEDLARVLINGQALQDSPRPMSHGDSLILGYAHAFRLVDPTPERVREAGSRDALLLARATIAKLDVASAVEEAVPGSPGQVPETNEPATIFPYLSHLSSRASDEIVQAFLQALHHIHPLVEEANLITKELLGTSGLALEIHALSNVLDFANDVPELVICVLEQLGPLARFQQTVKTVQQHLRIAAAKDRGDSVCMQACAKHPLARAMGLEEHMNVAGHGQLLFIWSLEDFLRRLSEIRDVYQDACEAGNFKVARQDLAVSHFWNPCWQPSFADLKVLADDSGSTTNTPTLRSPNQCVREPCDAPKSLPTLLGSGDAKQDTPGKKNVDKEDQRQNGLRKNAVPSKAPVPIFARRRPAALESSSSSASSRPEPTSPQVDSRSTNGMSIYWKTVFLEETGADVYLAASEGHEGQPAVAAHRLVLCRLPFFERLLASSPTSSGPILVPNVFSNKVLRQIILYVYTDSTSEATAGLSPNMLRELQKAASSCDLPDLHKACCRKITDEPADSTALRRGQNQTGLLGRKGSSTVGRLHGGSLSPAGNKRSSQTSLVITGNKDAAGGKLAKARREDCVLDPMPEAVIYEPSKSQSDTLGVCGGDDQQQEASKQIPPEKSVQSSQDQQALLESLCAGVSDTIRSEMGRASDLSSAHNMLQQINLLKNELVFTLREGLQAQSQRDGLSQRCGKAAEPVSARPGVPRPLQSPPMFTRLLHADAGNGQPPLCTTPMTPGPPRVQSPVIQTRSGQSRSPSPVLQCRTVVASRQLNIQAASRSLSPLPRGGSVQPLQVRGLGARSPQVGSCTMSCADLRPLQLRQMSSSASTGTLSVSLGHSMASHQREPVASSTTFEQ